MDLEQLCENNDTEGVRNYLKNNKDDYELHALTIACENGNREILELLSSNSPDIFTIYLNNFRGCFLFNKHDVSFNVWILQKEPKLNNSENFECLCNISAGSGTLSVFKWSLSKLPKNIVDKNFSTYIKLAYNNNKYDISNYLLTLCPTYFSDIVKKTLDYFTENKYEDEGEYVKYLYESDKILYIDLLLKYRNLEKDEIISELEKTKIYPIVQPRLVSLIRYDM